MKNSLKRLEHIQHCLETPEQYDYIVIGGGQETYASAGRAQQLGARVTHLQRPTHPLPLRFRNPHTIQHGTRLIQAPHILLGQAQPQPTGHGPIAIVGSGPTAIEWASRVQKTHQVVLVIDQVLVDSVVIETLGLTVVFQDQFRQEEWDEVWWAQDYPVDRLDGLDLVWEGDRLWVDDECRTSIPHVYSLSRCDRVVDEGIRLSDRLFGSGQMKNYVLPKVILSQPVVCCLGYTEKEAREKFESVKIYQSEFVNLFFSLMDEKERTVYKMVVAGPEERVVGLHLIGRGSEEVMQGFVVPMSMGATKADFDRCIAIHPTAAEELVTMV